MTDETVRWMNEALVLAANGQDHLALDVIYDNVDELLIKGEFVECDSILANYSPVDLPLDISLGLLTITMGAPKFLPSREAFYILLKQKLVAEGADVNWLLAGLGLQYEVKFRLLEYVVDDEGPSHARQ